MLLDAADRLGVPADSETMNRMLDFVEVAAGKQDANEHDRQMQAANTVQRIFRGWKGRAIAKTRLQIHQGVLVCPGNLRVWKNTAAADIDDHETNTVEAVALQTEAYQMCKGLKLLQEDGGEVPKAKVGLKHHGVTLEGVNDRVSKLDAKLDAILKILSKR